ncbi:MAG: hypothetical protein C4302_01240 [Thermus sp.]
MKRFLLWVLVLLVVVLGGLGAYWVYRTLSDLEARILRLETAVSAQSQSLKALGERLSGLEQRFAQEQASRTPPLALPELPKPESGGTASFWTFLAGVLLILLLLALALWLLRRRKEAPLKEPRADDKPGGEASAEAQGLGEGAPPQKEKEGGENRTS